MKDIQKKELDAIFNQEQKTNDTSLIKKLGTGIGAFSMGALDSAGLNIPSTIIPGFKKARKSLEEKAPISDNLGVGLGAISSFLAPGVGPAARIASKLPAGQLAKLSSKAGEKFAKVFPKTPEGASILAKMGKAGATGAVEGAGWFALDRDNIDTSNPVAFTSDVFENTAKGALTGAVFGGGTNLAGQGIGALTGLTKGGLKRVQGNINQNLWGRSGEAPANLKNTTDFFKPSINTIIGDLDAEDLRIINKGAETNYGSLKDFYKKAPDLEKLNVLTRWIDKKYPKSSLDMYDLANKINEDINRLGVELGDMRKEFKGLLTEQSAMYPWQNIAKKIEEVYKLPSGSFVREVNKNLLTKEELQQVLPLIRQVQTLEQQGMSRDLVLSNIKQSNISQKIKDFVLESFDDVQKNKESFLMFLDKKGKRESQAIKEAFIEFVSTRDNPKALTIADFDNDFRQAIDSMDVFPEAPTALGKKAQSDKTQKLRNFIHNEAKDAYNEFTTMGRTYKQVNDEYSALKRAYVVLAGQDEATRLSAFQYAHLIRPHSQIPLNQSMPLLLGIATAGAIGRKSQFPRISAGIGNLRAKTTPYINPANTIKKGLSRLSIVGLSDFYKKADINDNKLFLNEDNDTPFDKQINIEKKKVDDQSLAPMIDVEAMEMKERLGEVVEKNLPEEVVKSRIEGKQKHIPEWKIRQYEDDMTSAISADYLMQKIEKGNLLRKNVEDFKYINPHLYDRIAIDLYRLYNEDSLKLNFSQKLALGTFLGQDITGTEKELFYANPEDQDVITADGQQDGSQGQAVKGYIRKGFADGTKSATQRLNSPRG